MLYRTLVICSLLISSSFSLGLDELVQAALKNNFELKKIDKNIQISNENIKLSQLWEDPSLTIGANDIQFDAPFQRNKEAMQAQYIAITQVVPVNGKIAYLKSIAIDDRKIIEMDLENKKLQLISTITQIVYQISLTKKKQELIEKYQKNTKNLEEFSMKLYENGRAKQITTLNAKLLNSKLDIQKENLNFLLKKYYLQLEQITYIKIKNIKEELNLEASNKQDFDISQHPVMKSLQYQKEKYQSQAKLEEAKKISDIKFNLGYFARDEKFSDYASLSFTFSLPVQGKENINIAKARYQIAKVLDDFETTKIQFQKNIEILQEDMKKSYANYKNITDNMIVQRDYIQENIEAHNTLGHTNSVEIFQNINETLSLEMMALDELEKYYLAFAKSLYFRGSNS